MNIELHLIWNDLSETTINCQAWDVFDGTLIVMWPDGDSEFFAGVASVTCYTPGIGLETIACWNMD